MRVFAYELLFRSGAEAVLQDIDLDQTTSSGISNTFYITGIDTLTGGVQAFIPFTRNLLLQQYVKIFPKNQLVVELLANMQTDKQMLDAIQSIRKEGYKVALNGIDGNILHSPLIDYVDIIKVDISLTSRIERSFIARRFLPRGYKLVAEKVETHEEFHAAKELGYSLFQGNFFSQPSIVSTKRIPESKLTKIQLLQVVNQPELDFNKTTEIIKHDVALSYKLLRFANSAYLGLQQEVTNIRQALMFLGHRNLRKWISFMAVASLGDNKPSAIVTIAMVRARFCELLAKRLGMGARGDDLFLLGMLSMIDALLDRPMKEALNEIPIAPNIKSCLLGKSGKLRDILDLVLAYEVGDWQRINDFGDQFEIEQNEIPEFHLEAVKMADSVFKDEEVGAGQELIQPT